jgi:hypothetical protein
MVGEKKVLTVKLNKSLTYMLPFIDQELDLEFNELILNSYISNEEGDDVFCILYNWKSDQNFLKYEGELMKSSIFIGHEDYEDKVLYKFKMSEDMIAARKKYIKGEYKNFSKDHREAIISYLTRMRVPNLKNIVEILDKNASRSSEPPVVENEIFTNSVRTINYKTESFTYEGY